jgi:dipeptide/tripeptide permease
MNLISILATAIGTAAVGASVFSLLKYLWERWEQKGKGKEPTLQDRISNLTKNLESSVAIITEIETEISKRKNLAQQLEADIERYNKLKEINKAQVEAIAQTLRIPLVKESRKSLIINAIVTFVVALIFFAIGYFVGGR